MKKKIQLGILFGSRACEHEVSIISALQLASMADPFKYDVIPIYISKKGEWYIGGALWKLETYLNFDPRKSGLTRVFPDLSARSHAFMAFKRGGVFRGERRYAAVRLDAVIPVLHGQHGEDGSVMGMLELMNLPYAATGVAGSAVGMDKIMMKRLFDGCGFPVLADTSMTHSFFEKDREMACLKVEAALPYPVFVKPANLGSSIGVSRAGNRAELITALELAFTLDRRVLIEQGLDDPIEVNSSVLCFDEDVTPSVVEMPVREGTLLDFKTKYLASSQQSGMASLSRLIPAPISEEDTQKVQQTAVDIFKALDCKGVVRVDFMIDRADDSLYITEINTIPGSLAFYLWEKTGEGMSYRALIDRLVDCAFTASQMKERLVTSFQSDIIASAIARRQSGAKGSKG
ncbi:MAG: D-alanine--D-alanine ligase [Clostridiales bacterium]|nr:D-alanine--D-alanine ligase [Clostridiales bacterium]